MRIRVHPAFAAYLLCVLALTSPWACAGLVISLTVHELGHWAAAFMLYEPISRVELAPFGGVMTCAPGRSMIKGLRGVVLAAAGPLASYALIAMVTGGLLRSALPEELTRQIVLSSGAMLVLNLMPALPLDGGSIVFSVGYYLFGIARLTALLCAMGVMLGAGLLALAVCGTLRAGQMNLSLLVVGGYLIVCAVRSRAALLTENLFAVVEECLRGHPSACRRVTTFRVPGEMPVIRLLPLMTRTQSASFWVERGEETPVLLDERAACRAMLSNPQMSAEEAAQIFRENAEK